MSSESINVKRLRTEPKNYNFNRNYTVKRAKSESSGVKRKATNYGVQTTIFDSGAYSIKHGNINMNSPIVIPNSIIKAKAERKRPFIGSQLEDCRDLSGLYYLLPCERGYITKWDVQKPIWDYVFHSQPLEDHCVIMTQPMFNFRSIQECMDEIFFEEYEVQSLLRANPTDLAYHAHIQSDINDSLPPCIVVDSGFSFTHIVPYIDGKKYFPSMIRIDIGGKLLTNYMKDIISYRQLHVMEETYVINQVKEDSCFVSANLRADMKVAQQSGLKNSIVRNYVLPDFNNIRRGFIQEPGTKLNEIAEGCQILRLNNERFTVPELLLHPSNIGMECMGIAEAIAKCIKNCPLKFQASLAKNIVLIGGNANFPGYKERIYSDVRSMLPYHFQLNVYKPDNPVTYPWSGGKTISKSSHFEKLIVSKHDYEEYGSNLTFRRFNDMKNADYDDDIDYEDPVQKVSLLANIKGRSIFGKFDIEDEESDLVVSDENKSNESPSTENESKKESDSDQPLKKEEETAVNIQTSNEPTTTNNPGPQIQIVALQSQLGVKLAMNSNVSNVSSSNGVHSVIKTSKKPLDLANCVTLEDILKAAGNKDIKICSAPNLVRTIPLQTNPQQNIIRMVAPNGNQSIRQVVRIHHYPQQAVIKNITLNNSNSNITLGNNSNITINNQNFTINNQKIAINNNSSSRSGGIQTQSILRLPVSTTQTVNGQQITILPRSSINPILTQIPVSVSTSGSPQILRLNYTVPKLTAIKPQTQEPSTSVLKDLYPATSSEQQKTDKTVVLVKQVFLKKN